MRKKKLMETLHPLLPTYKIRSNIGLSSIRFCLLRWQLAAVQWQSYPQLLPSSKLPHLSSFYGSVLPVVRATERLWVLFREQLGARAKLSLQARTRPRLSRHAVKCLLNIWTRTGHRCRQDPPQHYQLSRKYLWHLFINFISVCYNAPPNLTRVLIMNLQ